MCSFFAFSKTSFSDVQTRISSSNTSYVSQDIFCELVKPGSVLPFHSTKSSTCVVSQCPHVSAQAPVIMPWLAPHYSFGNNLPSPSLPKCLAAFASSILSLISPSLILHKVLTSTSISFPVFASNQSPFVFMFPPSTAF